MNAPSYNEETLEALRTDWVKKHIDTRDLLDVIKSTENWIDYYSRQGDTISLHRESIKLADLQDRFKKLLEQQRAAWRAYENYARAFYHYTNNSPMPPTTGEIKDTNENTKE